jgi:alpha-ketoglutarate-dependent taurine dioxygenase
VPPFTAQEQELLDLYEAIASSPDLYLDMQFQPGDIQLISNHTILHSRTAYEDPPDPAHKRHLLRLWLSLESDHANRPGAYAPGLQT